jgi:hypothetical protein
MISKQIPHRHGQGFCSTVYTSVVGLAVTVLYRKIELRFKY